MAEVEAILTCTLCQVKKSDGYHYGFEQCRFCGRLYCMNHIEAEQHGCQPKPKCICGRPNDGHYCATYLDLETGELRQ